MLCSGRYWRSVKARLSSWAMQPPFALAWQTPIDARELADGVLQEITAVSSAIVTTLQRRLCGKRRPVKHTQVRLHELQHMLLCFYPSGGLKEGNKALR